MEWQSFTRISRLTSMRSHVRAIAVTLATLALLFSTPTTHAEEIAAAKDSDPAAADDANTSEMVIGERPAPPPPIVSPSDTKSDPKNNDEDIEIKLVAPIGGIPGQKLAGIKDVAEAVDTIIEKDLQAMELTHEALCDDPAFLRRVTLDITGQIPTAQDINEFLHSPPEKRRAGKIDELIKSPEYSDRWASFWTGVLVGGERQRFQELGINRLRKWLHDHLQNNTPYDAWVEQLLTAYGTLPFVGTVPSPGDTTPHSPAIVYLGYHLQQKGLPETMGHVTRTFLGIRMGCAQCHDHPFDKWTQQDFWKLSAFLSFTSGSEYNLTDSDTRLTGEMYDPPEEWLKFDPTLPGYAKPNFIQIKEKPAPKRPQKNYSGYPSEPPRRPKSGIGLTYRQTLAQWIIDPVSGNLDRQAVNRIWQALFGHGMVEPVDDMRAKNPPTHPDAMELLASDFQASHRDLKRLITIIANTRAYQRSSLGAATGKERLMQVRYAARAEVRPMTPEMLFCAVLKATGGEMKARAFLDGLRHTEQYNSRAGNNDVTAFYNLLQQFDVGSSAEDAAGSVQFTGTVTLALTMMHSTIIQRLLQSSTGSRSPESLFANMLCRAPTKEEQDAAQKLPRGAEDLRWVLINCAEFFTIH